MKQYIYIRTFL